MNQILFNKKQNNKRKYMFKVQFIISTVVTLILIINFLLNYNREENLENLSKIINKKLQIYSYYTVSKTQSEENIYLGRIVIDKINLEYSVFNEMNEELLKISPCKFFGVNFGEKGNICIAGHNYNDSRFFSRLDELKEYDIIKLIDCNGNVFEYTVFDIFEIEDDDLSILKSTKNYELTLLTCNNSNKKRIIVKAYMREY